MARPRSVDREQLLDVAESIVASAGAASLSFGSLANAAALSKATVQTAFGTREAMIEALLARWMAREAEAYQAILGSDKSPTARLKAHLLSTQRENDVGKAVSALLAALFGNGGASVAMRNWYWARMENLNADDLEGRQRRLAYLAAEGAFLLKNLVGLDIDQAKWNSIFKDIEELGASETA